MYTQLTHSSSSSSSCSSSSVTVKHIHPHRLSGLSGEFWGNRMVHTQFIWSKGGNQVFLCGDFTGWIRYHPMAAVEGSSTTFMTICDLPPGMHKYKFLVDGVWRVDDQQLYHEDETGTNNVVVVEPPELIPQTLLMDGGIPIMDIDSFDNRNYDDGASTSNSVPLPHGPVLALTADDIETTRHRVTEHLLSHKVFELIPDSGKVFVLDTDVTVEEAFLIMHEEGLAVAPLWDEANRRIAGMLTASDFIVILMELQRNRARVTDNLLELQSVSAWKEAKIHLERRPLVHADPDESLSDVAVRILGNQISTVPILYVAEHTTVPQLLHLACLGGLLENICKHFEHCPGYLPLLQQAVGGLRIGTWIREIGGARELLMLLPNHLLSDAFKLLMEGHISSMPIIDEKGALVNVFSRRDITLLAKRNVYVHIQLDQATVFQALQLVDGNIRAKYGVCTRSDSLYSVMTQLSDPGVRRVVVVEPGTQRVLGIITLRDVFGLIFREFP